MNDTGDTGRQFGEGPLSRVAALIYTLMVVEVLLLVASAPGLVPALFLARDASNIPLAALCLLPLGPALSAALYALHRHRGDLTDLRPVAAFRRGYRLNALGVLWVWVPWLVWMAVLTVNLVHLSAAGVPPWWAAMMVGIATGATLWLANALVITSLFAFRARDVARLAAYFLVRTPGATLATFCLVVVAAGVTVLFTEAVLALLGSVFAMALLLGCRPVIAAVERDFVG